eukprot:CAMPEP_0197275092 /NCGR_PEP_ID=MMETSP1432-20130617/13490_1 /TAXON_ID=44447 /ORGANISM="Pseudo-nitzschia delicatissima, Strain UNC1205" /LENGTH=259 /DNA_ID=CAMNT_0042740963 /DNA_START=43 /DNA_END=822 /DNA_ORIENTATION=+
MPPLNEYAFAEPLLVTSNIIDAGINSPSSFDRTLECEGLRLPLAFLPPREKSVSFNHQAEVEYLPSHRDWTQEERFSRWYSNDDYTHFQLDIYDTIYLRRNDPESIDDTTHSARGVECRDPIVRRRRRQWKQEAWDAVFEQQRIQRKMNNETDGYNYLVASMYYHLSQPATRAAIDFAARDEIDANEYERQDNTCLDEGFVDLFNDSWISTVASSHSEGSSNSNLVEGSSVNNGGDEDFGFSVFGEKSGFDNSWLMLES